MMAPRVRPAFRLLPLPLLIAMSLAAHADDEQPPDWSLCPIEDAVPSFMDAQPAVGTIAEREKQPTDVDGDAVSGIDGDSVNVSGNVTLRRGDQFLGTDDLQYSQETGTYTATGNVRYQDSGMRIVADRLEGDQNTESHKIDNVRYQLVERRGNGGAERIEMAGAEGRMHGSTYSTCPPSQRMWELQARRIDVNTDTGMGVARGAKLRIGKVPVLYVPWFAFPIDDRRTTGLLYPSISNSGRNGLDWRQPIYLNLAPNYDLTLEPRWMSRRGLQLGGEFRYLRDGGQGVFEAEYLPSDNLTTRERAAEIADPRIRPENYREEDRAMFSYRGTQRIDRTWQARANLTWISDPRYIEDSSNNLDGNVGTYLRSSVGVYGRSAFWNAGLVADYYQLTDYLLPESAVAYHRLPRAYFRWEQPFGNWLVAGLDSDLTRFSHLDSSVRLDGSRLRPGGTRLYLKPYLSAPIEGSSWFIRPTVAWRYTGYRVDEAANGDRSPSSSMPITSVDAGLFFERNMKFRGDSFLHTLEPRMFYLNAPYRDQSGLPLFDTRPLTFSWGQLFRDNRYSGADRQADANQLTLALTTRMIRESDGREKLSASIGQIHYFDDSRTSIAGESPVGEGKSAWISDTTYAINDRWTISAGYQWNPSSRSDDLISMRTRYLIRDEGIVNLSYRYRRNPNTQADLLEQADLSFLYPISPSWSLVGRYYYSLLDNQMLEGIAGVQWESCCMAARVVARRYVRNRQGEMNDAIQFELEFKGLGSAGPDTEGRLRRAILGYYRDDLYLVPPSQLNRDTDSLRDANP